MTTAAAPGLPHLAQKVGHGPHDLLGVRVHQPRLHHRPHHREGAPKDERAVAQRGQRLARGLVAARRSAARRAGGGSGRGAGREGSAPLPERAASPLSACAVARAPRHPAPPPPALLSTRRAAPCHCNSLLPASVRAGQPWAACDSRGLPDGRPVHVPEVVEHIGRDRPRDEVPDPAVPACRRSARSAAQRARSGLTLRPVLGRQYCSAGTLGSAPGPSTPSLEGRCLRLDGTPTKPLAPAPGTSSPGRAQTLSMLIRTKVGRHWRLTRHQLPGPGPNSSHT